ncbi:MAG: Holliday junction branch migration protein RuvA [Oscillospiraceae bacterium]|nr:Holliday junction branch migration protein RuvA [Oscillospiraceae bacterium]
MFYYLKGKITVIEQNLAVVDCGGIGFQCVVSMNTLSHLELGQDVTLYTYCNIREDGVDVFGFYELSEKRSFEMLLGVSGVGPKAAISILSSVTPEGLALAVLNHDEKMITAAQGVGKKIAQRIILELQDKISKESAALSAAGKPSGVPASAGSTKYSDASAALSVLGFTPAEASALLRSIDVEGLSLEEIIKEALKLSQ